MSNRKRLSRRMRRARFYLVAILLLIALVLGIWILVLDEDAPFNKRLSQDAAATVTPLPDDDLAGATDQPTQAEPTAAEVTPSATPETAATDTPEPLPTPTVPPTVPQTDAPTPAETPAPTDAATDAPVAEPTDAPTPAETPAPTDAATDAPVAEPTDEPAPAETPAPTDAATDAPVAEPTDAPAPTPAETPESTAAPEMARVTLASNTGKLNLRAEPSKEARILAELPHGKLVRVIGRANGWANIEADGLTGYVRADYLSKTTAADLLDLPYYIEVDRGMQVVRVYTIGEDGTYSILSREMICSTDTFERKPPNGTYVMNGEKLRWLITLTPDSYAQYATRITGHILFHSLPYSRLEADSLKKDDYALLGTNASIGCVRLLCADAKWIYDNVPAGTVVRYMTSERSEEKLAELAPPPLASGKWDPTDNREDNPDYSPDYEQAHPAATPVPGVTPAPTAPWTPDTYS